VYGAIADALHARVVFSIVKNNRKQWIGDAGDFLHLQVAVSLANNGGRGPMRRERRVGTEGVVC
jgi:hypothetical protein